MTATAEVARTARAIYDERDDDGQLQALELHEQLFLSAIASISRKCVSLRGDARRNPNLAPDDVERVIRLADRQEAQELREALASYRSERERFYNDDLAQVAHVMAAAE